MSEEIVQLNADQKSMAIKTLEHILLAASITLKDVKEDALEKEIRDSLIYLLSRYSKELAEYTNYDGTKSENDIENSLIKYLNSEIKRLNDAVKSKNSIAHMRENMRELFKIIEKWWKECGFHFVKEVNLNTFGNLFVVLGFDPSYMESFSTTPESDKERNKMNIEKLSNKGMTFQQLNDNKYEVLDNDKNKEIILQMIKSRFPSSKIIKWESFSSHEENVFILQYVEIRLDNLAEVVTGM